LCPTFRPDNLINKYFKKIIMGLNKEDSHIQENDNFVKWLGLTNTHNTKTEN